jgi:DNA polymerase-1
MIQDMHRHGIWLNIPVLKDLERDLDIKERELSETIDWWLGRPFDAGSPDKVAALLFDELHLEPPGRVRLTKSGKRPSVDDDCLAPLADLHPVVPLIQDLRGVRKLKNTYVLPLPLMVREDGRVHTTFRTTVARTGRLASEDPNLMNIPIRDELGLRVREAFQAQSPNTTLASLDLSQIEMRVAAHYSQDPVMMDIFHRDLDIHVMTACGLFRLNYDEVAGQWKLYKSGALPADSAAWFAMKYFEQNQRLPAKTLGFQILYGATGRGLQQNILAVGGPYWEVEACDTFIEAWFALYSFIRDWMDLQYSRARRYGMVWDMFGRPRLIPGARSAIGYVSARALREAGNQPIQAGAQGIIKLAMAAIQPVVEMYQAMGEVCWPLIQVHDELLFELGVGIADDFLGEAKAIMENVVPLSVPVRSSASTGRTWRELK